MSNAGRGAGQPRRAFGRRQCSRLGRRTSRQGGGTNGGGAGRNRETARGGGAAGMGAARSGGPTGAGVARSGGSAGGGPRTRGGRDRNLRRKQRLDSRSPEHRAMRYFPRPETTGTPANGPPSKRKALRFGR